VCRLLAIVGASGSVFVIAAGNCLIRHRALTGGGTVHRLQKKQHVGVRTLAARGPREETMLFHRHAPSLQLSSMPRRRRDRHVLLTTLLVMACGLLGWAQQAWSEEIKDYGKPGSPINLVIGYQPYYTESWSGVIMRGKK